MAARHSLGDVIDDVQNPEAPAMGPLVMDEVERPAGIGPGFHEQRRPDDDADRTLAAFALPQTKRLATAIALMLVTADLRLR